MEVTINLFWIFVFLISIILICGIFSVANNVIKLCFRNKYKQELLKLKEQTDEIEQEIEELKSLYKQLLERVEPDLSD